MFLTENIFLMSRKAIYYRQTYKLLITSIVMQNKLHYYASSASYSDVEDVISTTIIQPNKVIDIVSIDTLKNEQQNIDENVTLGVYLMEQKGKKLLMKIQFDMRKQKIISPNGQDVFKKTIKQGGVGFKEGFIQYKFIGLNSAEITEATYQQLKDKKAQIDQNELSLQAYSEIQRFQQIIDEKDNVIGIMEKQLEELTQNAKRTKLSLRQVQTSFAKDSHPISFSVNYRPSDTTDKEQKRLIKQNQSLKAKVFRVTDMIEKVQKEKQQLEQKLRQLEAVNNNNNQVASISRPPAVKDLSSNVSENSSIIKKLDSDQIIPCFGTSESVKNESSKRVKKLTTPDIIIQQSKGSEVLERKVKESVKQIKTLENEIKQLRRYNQKLTQELNLLHNNNKDDLMRKVHEIKAANENIINDLKQKGGNIHQILFAHQKQNYQIQIETLKTFKEQLEFRCSHLINQLKAKSEDYLQKISASQEKQKQKDAQYKQMRNKLLRTMEHLRQALSKQITEQDVDSAAAEIAKNYVVIQQQKVSMIKGLQEQKMKVFKAQQKQRELNKIINLKAQKQAECKRIELVCQKQIEQINSFQKLNAKYQKRYDQLKKYLKQIEDKTGSRRKKESKLNAELEDKLSVFEEMIGVAESQFMEDQIAYLKAERDRIIQLYYKKIGSQKKIIDQDDSLAINEKKDKKERRQKQLKAEKVIKLDEIEQKLKNIEFKKSVVKDLYSRKKMIAEDRLEDIQKLLKEGQVERRQLSQRMLGNKTSAMNIKMLDQSIFLNDSAVKNLERPQVNNIPSMQKDLMDSIKQRQDQNRNKIAFEQSSWNRQRMMRSSYLQEWNKVQEATRKELKKQQEQNTKLKMQNLTLIRKTEAVKQQKERALHSLRLQFKEHQNNLKRTIAKLEKQAQIKETKIASLSDQLQKRKQTSEEQKQSINTLQRQYKLLSDELEKQILQSQSLKCKNQGLLSQLDSYEKTAQKLIQEVEKLNRINQEDKKQFQRLFEERSNAFMHIQQIKSAQIEKLNRIKEQLQFRLEQEVSSTMRVKGDNSQLFEKNNEMKQLIQQYEASINIIKENFQTQKRQLNEKVQMLEEVNLQIEKDLMTLAEDFNHMEQNRAMDSIEKQTLQKQVDSYKHLQSEVAQLEIKTKNEKKELELTILDQREKLRKMETDFFVFQQKMKMVIQENLKLRQQVKEKDVTIDNLKEKINEKSLEIIKISQEKSVSNIEKMQTMKEIEQLKKQVERYPDEISKLKEQNLKLSNDLQELTQQISTLRKLSEEKQDLPVETEDKISFQYGEPRIRSSKTFDVGVSKDMRESSIRRSESSLQKEQIESKKIIKIPSEVSNRKSRQPSPQHFPIQSSRSISRSRLSRRRQSIQGESLTTSPLRIVQKSQIINGKQDLQQKLLQLEEQRKDLLDRIAELQFELDNQKQLTLNKMPSKGQNIKIDEYSLENTNENTNEGGFINNLNLTDSNQLYQTVRSAETDYSAQLKNLELMVEELEKDKKMLNDALEEQKSNNQKLIDLQGQINQLHEDYSMKIEELTKYYEQKIQQLYNGKKDYEEKIEQLIGEMMVTDGKLTDSLRQLENCESRIIELENEINNCQGELQNKNTQSQQYECKIIQMKSQFRKYEEEAELQILILREKLEEVVAFNKEKDNQLIEMGQKYLNLEEGADHQNSQMLKVKQEIHNITRYNQILLQGNKKIEKQRQQFNQSRQKMMKKIHELQIQVVSKHEEIAQANKNAALATAKSNIKIQNIEEELNHMKQRQEEREKVVVSLKNQIANYNEQCLQLKKVNQQLDYELQRVTKQLKEIMKNYEGEFASFSEERVQHKKVAQALELASKDKQKVLVQLRQELRESEKLRINAEGQLKDIKIQYEKYRQVQQKQYNAKTNELQIKKNELQMLKATYQKLVEQNFLNESRADQQRQKYDKLYHQNRQKMTKYEEALEELSKQIEVLADGPDKAIYEQTLFENSIFRTRITELENQQKKKHQKAGNAEEMIQIQFRKYKANKEAVIQNLEAEMEGYSSRVNELEERNYYIKKENDRLRGQIERLNDCNYDLSEEVGILREDIEELKDEVNFYKDRRKQELTKLLNETND